MNEQFRNFHDLVDQVIAYLTSRLFFSPLTLAGYRRAWRRILEYMIESQIDQYDKEVEKRFLHHEFGDRGKRDLSQHERFRFNGAMMLTQFQETSRIDLPVSTRKTQILFEGPLGQLIIEFLDYKRNEERLSMIRLHCYERNLFRFYQFCHERRICSISDIDLVTLLQFINSMDSKKSTPIYTALSTLRGFMKYVFNQGFSVIDYSIKIPKYKSVNQPKIPSTYSKKEIEKLISSIKRSSAMGKRNYAIILLAAKLGLRASDISRMRFENLHWDNSTISMQQVKTGKMLNLPLLPDVGNALIDYLKYGRPESKEPFVFLTGRPPYEPFSTSNVVTHVVQRAFIKSGINIKGRKFGSHSLRHSLGFRMLEESTVLPVISEVLGHKSTESTRYYLRIDLRSMQQCMLDVPAVSRDFYEQKGGIFYE